MSEPHADSGVAPVRASDAERDHAAEILRAGYAEGRLTRAELDDRLGAAYAAKTLTDLRVLTSDLPGAIPVPVPGRSLAAQDQSLVHPSPGATTGMCLDRCLLVCLLIACPPAGIAYLVLAARRQSRSASGEPRSVLPSAGATR